MSKYIIEKFLMDEINYEEKAYWLGFFYADAYNNEKLGRIVIELQEQDREHLIKCARFFGKPRDPFKQLKNKGKYIAFRLELNSKHLSQSLASKGCHQTKSFDIKFPTWLNDNLIHHFIRGYFDGDGSIYIHQDQLNIEFASTQEMCISINAILSNLNISGQMYHPKRYKNNTYKLCFGGSRQVKRFCEWLYKDATIYLDRKYDVYKSYCISHVFKFND